MPPIEDHPLRYSLSNELHARPFPSLDAPCFAVYLAIKEPKDAAGRDRAKDRAHLVALLDRFGAQHPKEGATHWFGEMGKYRLKWEQHTEFVTYTLFGDGVADKPFDPSLFKVFPAEWLAQAPGARITSALIRVETRPTPPTIRGSSDRLVRARKPGRVGRAGRHRGDRQRFSHRHGGPHAHGGVHRPQISDRGGSGGSCSGCARSRPTRRCRCWGWRGRANWARGWARLDREL